MASTTMRSLRIVRSAALGLAVALILVLVLSTPWKSEAPETGSNRGGWQVVSGRIAAAPQAPGGFVTRNAVTLRRGQVSVAIGPQSRFRFPVAPSGETVVLPHLVDGSMAVVTGEPVALDGYLLSPETQARLWITGNRLEVVDGSLRLEDRVIGPGEVLSRGIVTPEREEPDVESDGTPAPQSEPPPPPTGRVVDARTSSPLRGARVRATYSHSDDGYPPLPGPRSRYVTESDEEGRFWIPPFRAGDPRLKLHLELDLAGYLPLVHVIEEEPDVDGRWTSRTLGLRRALTRGIRCFDPQGRPLPGVALEIVEHDTDFFVGEDSWDEGRTVRADRALIRYTDHQGVLWLGRRPVTVYLRHPLLHVRSFVTGRALEGRVLDDELERDLDDLPEGSLEIHTAPGLASEYVFEDASGYAVSNALVEVHLDGMRPVRLYTDDHGVFEFAPRPFPGEERLRSGWRPRPGTLTALSPLLWKHQIAVEMPSTATRLVASGRLGSRLRIVVGELDGEYTLRPVPAEDVRLDSDLTLVHRTREGEIILEGALPAPDTLLMLSLRGFLPAQFKMPVHLAGTALVDGGQLALERGISMRVWLSGGASRLYERARLRVADADYGWLTHDYRFDASGQVIVSGLVESRFYTFAVEGSRLKLQQYRLPAVKKYVEEGLEIPLGSPWEVDTFMRGEVVGVSPEHSHRYQVLERYYLEGERDPVTCVAYPLPPDGFFGSHRLLPASTRVEVFVVGPGFFGGHAARDRVRELWEFDVGRIVPKESRHAIFTFAAEGAGLVLPPENIVLFAETNSYHEVVRQAVVGAYLVLANLMPGRYLLRWDDDKRGRGTFDFEVEEKGTKTRGVIPLPRREVEEVVIRVVDEDGKPVENAEISTAGRREKAEEAKPERGRTREGAFRRFLRKSLFGQDGGGRTLPVGQYLVELRTKEENRVRISAEEFLPLRLVVPAGVKIPEQLVLTKGVRVEALILDVDRLRFDGELHVSWEPLEEDGMVENRETEPSLSHGEPFTQAVREGLWRTDRLPAGMHRLFLRRSSSAAKAEREVELLADRVNDLETIQLDETRTISGTVELPGGEPAAGAVVALVEPENAYRFPQRAVDLETLKFAVKTDGVGRFRIDGLPLDLREELALVAHLPGWTDALEIPLDLDARERVLVLDENTGLVLDVGHRDPRLRERYHFRLEYGLTADEDDYVDLGPLAEVPLGGQLYEGVTPGVYRVVWELRDGRHPGVLPRSDAVLVAPGRTSTLALRVDDVLLEGSARFNGRSLNRGWILLSDNPGDPGASRVARVSEGEFEIAAPAKREAVYVALVPERKPLPVPDFYRGVALPQKLSSYPAALREGLLPVSYKAYDLTLELPQELLAAHPDLEVEFPHYLWERTGFRVQQRAERVTGTPFLLPLLSPGNITVRFSGGAALRSSHTFYLQEDTVLPIRR